MKRLLLLLLLSSCSLAPPYAPPVDDPPTEWKEPPLSGKELKPCQSWWLIFNDPLLNDYEELALKQNPTLEIAYQRIMEARGLAEIAASPLYPQFFINWQSFNSGTVTPSPTGGIQRIHLQDYTLPLDASYEIDLFGRIRNQAYAANLEVAVRAFDYVTATLTLTTDVALTYFGYRALDSQIDVLLDTIASRQSEVEVTQSRYDAGLVNYSDVSRALNQLATSKGDLEVALQARRELENSLAVLLGYYASDFSAKKDPLNQEALIAAPVSPAQFLSTRPDVASAERKMAEQNALIGSALAGYYPFPSISGTLGYSSLTIGKLFDWQSRLWEWATQVTQMVFDGGNVEGRVAAQRAIFLQAVSNYADTTLRAYEEIENALSADVHTRNKFNYDQEAVSAAEDTRTISNERYLKGLVTYLDVVDAERTLLLNRLERERSRFETYQSTIRLIKAIGGELLQNDSRFFP